MVKIEAKVVISIVIIYKSHMCIIIKMQKSYFKRYDIPIISLFAIISHFRMFPFVSIPPSQSITLRRWHRRRSRRNHDESDDKSEVSKLRQHSISQIKSTCIKSLSSSHLQQILFYVTFALLITVSQGNKLFASS